MVHLGLQFSRGKSPSIPATEKWQAWQLEQKLRTHIWNHSQETEMDLEMVQVLVLSLPPPVTHALQ